MENIPVRAKEEDVMISLIQYEEFGPGLGLPSMSDYFVPKPYEGQRRIVQYLREGMRTYSSTGLARDCYTGEIIPGERCGMTDGEYSWNSVLPYYVEKYNLRLPEDFERKVLKNNNSNRR